MLSVNQLYFISPEIFLLLSGLSILVLSLFASRRSPNFAYLMTLLAVFVTAVVCLQIQPDAGVIFSGHYISDQLGFTLKTIILLVSLLALFYSGFDTQDRQIPVGEFYPLISLAILGMMIMVSAHSLLMLYMGLELLSLPLYALVALDRNSIQGGESAMKYFVLGAVASGLFLYGISLVYGMTASVDYGVIANALPTLDASERLVAALGLVFILIAVSFKLGAAPFHMWVPDVYEGAPTAVTLFIASAPKVAAGGMLLRIIHDVLPNLQDYWQPTLMMVGVFSIVLGNVVAIAQTNIKRLFAYSAIAHMGFVILGFASGSDNGYSASLFYLFVYSLISCGGFAMVILLSSQGKDSGLINDFKGLNARNPWYALVMLLLVFAMAGVPPTVGFYAKLSVLNSLIKGDFFGVAAIAVLMSVIGAFYYLRIIKVMYFDAPDDPAPLKINSSFASVLSLNGMAVLALGLFPSALLVFSGVFSSN